MTARETSKRDAKCAGQGWADEGLQRAQQTLGAVPAAAARQGMVAYCPNLVQGSQLMAGRQALGALQDLSVGHPVMVFLDLF